MAGVTMREGSCAFVKFTTNSWGAPASVTKGAYFDNDGGISQQIEIVDDESFGQRFKLAGEPGNFPALTFSLPQSGKYADHSYILDALAMGSPNAVTISTSAVGQTTSWLHIIDMSPNTDGLGVTLAFDKVIHVEEVPSARCTGFTLSGDGSVIKTTYKFTGTKSTNISSINTRSTVNGANFPGLNNRMLMKHGTFRANIATGNTLAVGDAIPVEACSFEWDTPIDAPNIYGQDYIYEPGNNGFPDLTMSLTFPRMNTISATSFYNAHTAGTTYKGELRFLGNFINSTDQHAYILQMPALEVTATNQNTNGAAQIKPTVSFRLRGSASSVSGMPITWPMRLRRITSQSVVAF